MVWLVAMVAVAPQANFFSQVVPHPTGRNGYEEYVKAAVLASHPDLQQWEQPAPQNPAGLPASSTRLERTQWVSIRMKSVFDLIRQGNAKPVAETRDVYNASTLVPELSYFRRISRALSGAAYADFAAGRSSQGTERLLDNLVFGDNVSRTGTLISHLVGIAQMSIAFGAFEARLPQLSKPDCGRIVDTTTRLLDRPAAYATVLETERKLTLSAFEDVLNGTEKWVSDSEFGDLAHKLQGKSPAERAEIRRLGTQLIEDYFGPALQAYKGPERQWPILGNPTPSKWLQGPKSNEALTEALVESLTPSSSQGGQASLRSRTQLRLLRLHAWVLAYKWEHDKLPTRLEEAVPAEALIDPMNGEPFQYILNETGYRLVSTGRDGTGEVALRYQRPPEKPDPTVPPSGR